jgi:hypothetical protein
MIRTFRVGKICAEADRGDRTASAAAAMPAIRRRGDKGRTRILFVPSASEALLLLIVVGAQGGRDGMEG